jgi:hypothetical protein
MRTFGRCTWWRPSATGSRSNGATGRRGENGASSRGPTRFWLKGVASPTVGVRSSALAAAVLLASAAGCGASPQQQAAALAQRMTQAVYDDQPSAVIGLLEPAVAGRVTRGDVGSLSDRMHALGQLRAVRLVGLVRGREYTLLAHFTRGSMVVIVRLGKDGKLSAYRVVPPQRD